MRWCHICNSWQKNQKEIPFKFQFSINAKSYFPYCAFPSNLLTKRQSSDPLPEAASLHSSRANKFVIWISGTGSITFSWTLKGSQQSAMVFYRINANRMLLLIRIQWLFLEIFVPEYGVFKILLTMSRITRVR